MTLFQYPKTIHKRVLVPRQFKRYQTYKRYLQTEFVRVCVYCRQPDCSAPNLNFGVDHYRPKGIRRFASLVCSYDNLYYCCGGCNSRKNNDWPADEKTGPYIVNPCDHEMAVHLRFDSKTGRIDSRTPYGKHTVDLLQLNDETLVKFRSTTLKTISFYHTEILQIEEQCNELTRLHRNGKLSVADYEAETLDAIEELNTLRRSLQTYSGQLEIPALRKKKGNVTLLP